MFKKVKRFFFLIIIFLFILSGCQTGNEANTEKDNNSNNVIDNETAESNLTPPGTFPIVKEKVEITVLLPANSMVEDYETNAFTEWYEELTNVKVNFEVSPVGASAETLNLRLTGSDLPDVFMGMGVSRAQEMIYGSQGVFLPLNDLIEEQGHFIKEAFKEKPQYEKSITTPDGNIYALPEINECYHCSVPYKMWMNESFLTELNLKVPETTDDFYEVLKAFKEKDPNKNGKADEVPLAGAIRPGATKSVETQVEMFLMNAFVYTPGTRMYLDDGEIQVSYNQPGWKEGIKYLNKLYSEGLLAGESFTQDEQQLRQLGENADAPILGAFPGIYLGNGTEIGSDSGRWLDYITVPSLTGPNGERFTEKDHYQLTTGKFVITNASENPEVALRWADGFFDEEVMNRAYNGIPGVDYVEAGEDEISIDGGKAKYTLITPYGTITNNHWYQPIPAYNSSEARLSWSAGDDPAQNNEVILYNQSRDNYDPYGIPIEMQVPPLYFTEEQSMELADIEKTIKDYVDQMLSRFVTNDLDIDKEWDNYLSTLDSMNLERLIELNQDAYDALQ